MQDEFVELCKAIADPDPTTGKSRGETLRILVLDEAGAQTVRRRLEGLDVQCVVGRFGDVWLRDTGPIFGVSASGALAAHRFRFNGWGDKYQLEGDEQVAPLIAAEASTSTIEHSLVLEGGAVEFDGEGTVLTTRSCLLNMNRNPGLSADEVEAALRDALGADRVMWLSRGLLNDHTDGHIDTLVRFVAPGRVVCMHPSGDKDPNAEVLTELRTALDGLVDAQGRRLEVIEIPSPGRTVDDAGIIMPASYVNFYIANTTVVVPTYGGPHDAAAIDALCTVFPGRRVVGVHARRLLHGGGAFHCITQQQPSRVTNDA